MYSSFIIGGIILKYKYYRILIISNIQSEYNEEELYEHSRITFGIKDKGNLNKWNITPNNLPREKRIVLLNKIK